MVTDQDAQLRVRAKYLRQGAGAAASALRGHSCRRGSNRRVLCSRVAGRGTVGGAGVLGRVCSFLASPGLSTCWSGSEEEPVLKCCLPSSCLLVPGQNGSPSPSQGCEPHLLPWPRGPGPRGRGESVTPITGPPCTACTWIPSSVLKRGAARRRPRLLPHGALSCVHRRGSALSFKGFSVTDVSPPSSRVHYANCLK